VNLPTDTLPLRWRQLFDSWTNVLSEDTGADELATGWLCRLFTTLFTQWHAVDLYRYGERSGFALAMRLRGVVGPLAWIIHDTNCYLSVCPVWGFLVSQASRLALLSTSSQIERALAYDY